MISAPTRARCPDANKFDGDVRARHIQQEAVVEVQIDTATSWLVIDTPEALDAYCARPAR